MAVIVQYYVFFGVFFGILRKCKLLSNIWLVITFGFMLLPLWGINFLINQSIQSDSHSLMVVWQHSLLIHLPIFALGAALAAFGQFQPRTISKTWIWDTLGVASGSLVLLILASPMVDEIQWPGVRYGYPLIPGMLATVILAATRGGLIGKALAARPLVFLGSHLVCFLPDPSPNHWIWPSKAIVFVVRRPRALRLLAWNPCRLLCDDASAHWVGDAFGRVPDFARNS